MTRRTYSPGVANSASRAAVNGLLRPTPSPAVVPGRVAKDTSMAAGAAGPERAGERVIAAGVEEDEADPSRVVHDARDHVETHRVEVKVGSRPQLRVDRDEVVPARHLQPVPGVEEQRRPGAVDRPGEVPHESLEAAAVEVAALDHLDAPADGADTTAERRYRRAAPLARDGMAPSARSATPP